MIKMRIASAILAAGVATLSAVMLAGNALSQEKIELVFRQFDPPTEIAGLIAAVDAWNSSHPDVQVKLQTMTGGDTLAQLAREVPAGAGPDVQQLAFVWTRDLAKSKLLLDLDPLIKSAAPAAGIDDFLAVDLAKLDGKLFGVPWTADTFSMAYRPDLLQASSVEGFPDTWQALADAAKKLTNGDQYGFCFPAGSSPDSGMWILANYYLWSNGATLVNQDGSGKWTVSVTPEQLTQTIDYFNKFFVDATAPENLITVNAWGDPELVGGLGRGDCAITFFPPQTFRAAEKQSEKPLLTAPIPQGSAKRVSHLGGRALGINPNSKHQQEAWEFVQYLTGPETFKTYNQYPAQKSLLSKLQFPATEQGYVAMLPVAQTFERYISSPIPVSSMTALINREFGAVFSGQREPEEAASIIIKELNDLLARGKG
ncbi:sugar ABC transporter substrate-binding protein [Rhizobium sp. BG4]|uniref:ABC transporter substrate-binding protein n=1 Tax=Rhizobium sp. BG4 TaxID=2613770 RepID=UPI00193E7DC6|nr:sugar ABC transporter substrate-binding protein [Rhizobium sp. BG4]QRM47262.1 sugar ABC transporter substrate-binding protein [Rhizobium sp. BG4]